MKKIYKHLKDTAAAGREERELNKEPAFIDPPPPYTDTHAQPPPCKPGQVLTNKLIRLEIEIENTNKQDVALCKDGT